MSENGQKTRYLEEIGRSPQHWWEIMASKDAASLIFREYFSEMFGPARLIDLVEADNDFAFGRPVDDSEDGAWGEDSLLIEDWFAAGDDLEDDGWEPFIAEGWTDGVVLTRSGETISREMSSREMRSQTMGSQKAVAH